MDIVSEALQKTAKDAENYKTTEVEKHLDLEIDLGTLLAVDINEIDVKNLRENKDDFLLNLARDNTQLLFNQIWELPTERVDEAIVVKLPKPTYVLPRTHRVPKQKQMTKWEKFAKEKGIQKKKKPKVTYDEVLQKWVPIFGYKRAAAEKEKDWALEVPVTSDPYEDQFGKKAGAKSERVAKNELQRLRNLAVAKNIKVPKTGLAMTEHLDSKQLHTALTVARSSTASLGKFQSKLPKEKDAKKLGNLVPSNKKRKQPVPPPAEEKKFNMNMLDTILRKKPKIDMEKAINKELYHKEQERAEERANERPKKGKGKGGPNKRGSQKKGKGPAKQSGTKPKSVKGARAGKDRSKTGRKRR